MAKAKLFDYAVLWHPTEKQTKDDGAKSKVVIERKSTLATDEKSVAMIAAMEIPADYKAQLDQIEIVVRPF